LIGSASFFYFFLLCTDNFVWLSHSNIGLNAFLTRLTLEQLNCCNNNSIETIVSVVDDRLAIIFSFFLVHLGDLFFFCWKSFYSVTRCKTDFNTIMSHSILHWIIIEISLFCSWLVVEKSTYCCRWFWWFFFFAVVTVCVCCVVSNDSLFDVFPFDLLIHSTHCNLDRSRTETTEFTFTRTAANLVSSHLGRRRHDAQ
jgi:hypothetical protein